MKSNLTIGGLAQDFFSGASSRQWILAERIGGGGKPEFNLAQDPSRELACSLKVLSNQDKTCMTRDTGFIILHCIFGDFGLFVLQKKLK